jgi:PmbA protein
LAEQREVLELATHAVELAKRHGAEQCDAFVHGYHESAVTVRLGETEKLIEAGSRSLGLRVINGGRTAVCSTSDFTEPSFEEFVRDSVELANISAADEYAGLPDASLLARPGIDGLQLFDEQVGALTTEEQIAMAKACEGAAFAFDKRITNIDGATMVTRAGEVALANSLGFAASYPATSANLMVEVMADDAGGKKRNAYWYSSERSLHRLLDPGEVGRIAARRAIDQVGARKVGTKQAPVVWEPMMAASLLRDLAGCATGSALYHGSTFLAGREGQQVGSPLLNVTDDPTLPGRGGSRPFDGEGVSTRRTPLFREGTFEGFLFDAYTGRRTGNNTTGSAQRGIGSSPSPGASNLVFEPGATDPADIVGDVEEGLYLTTLMGFGFNPTTGDFSRGAAGFWIEKGKIAFPVTEVNISGRLDEMLAGIDAAGSDLTWFGGIAAPTIRIRQMMVSGL